MQLAVRLELIRDARDLFVERQSLNLRLDDLGDGRASPFPRLSSMTWASDVPSMYSMTRNAALAPYHMSWKVSKTSGIP